MPDFWHHEENYIYPQSFKENAIKLGVEVLIMALNDSSSKEIADTCTHSASNESC